MKKIMILSMVLGALPMMAQEADQKDTPETGGREAHRARLIKKFDKDGDGKLNEEEKAEMQKFIEERRKNGGAHGGRGNGKRKELIDKFDKDGDGKLSEEEKAEMQKFIEERRKNGGARGGRGNGKRKEMTDKTDEEKSSEE